MGEGRRRWAAGERTPIPEHKPYVPKPEVPIKVFRLFFTKGIQHKVFIIKQDAPLLYIATIQFSQLELMPAFYRQVRGTSFGHRDMNVVMEMIHGYLYNFDDYRLEEM